jgi:acetolactate synthase-1/2/3 large subunit
MAKIDASNYVAETVRVAGISHVFFVPVVLTRALVEMERLGIVPVMTHGEKAAAYMADGYARIAHQPGICLSQTIGAANLAAGLRDAFLARSPVIAITGGKSPEGQYRNVYQEVDDFAVFEPLTKFNVQVDRPDRLPDLLRQAFRSATTGCPQPVHLECAGLTGQVIEEEGEFDKVFESAFHRLPAFRPAANDEDIQRAARCLAQAERPVLVAGGGVKFSGAEEEVLSLARKLSLPVATSLNAKGTIPENDPLAIGLPGVYSRKCTNQILVEADLVFYVGSLTSSQVTNNWKIPPVETPVIQLDIDPDGLGRNYPNVASLCGDAKTVLRQLIDAVPDVPSREDWLGRCQQFIKAWREEHEPLMKSEQVPLRPERICRELSNALPEDAILVSETGHAGIWTGVYVELNHPGQTFIRAAGSLGWGFPAAMGAKCAAPDRPVICFSGDGGFYYHMAELETALRYNIPVVVIVNNNGALNMEKILYSDAYGESPQTRGLEMWQFKSMNFARVAEAMGCLGLRVEKPGELGAAIDQAVTSGRPAVIDVVSDIDILAPLGWAP